jgi:hypothetical protein
MPLSPEDIEEIRRFILEPDNNHFLNRGVFADKYRDALEKLSRLPENASRDTWWRDIRLSVGTMITLWQNMQIQLDNTIDHVNAVLTQILDAIEQETSPEEVFAETIVEQPEDQAETDQPTPDFPHSTWDPFAKD